MSVLSAEIKETAKRATFLTLRIYFWKIEDSQLLVYAGGSDEKIFLTDFTKGQR